jgi:hypothetical protein
MGYCGVQLIFGPPYCAAARCDGLSPAAITIGGVTGRGARTLTTFNEVADII